MVLNDSMSLDNMRVLFLYPNQRSMSIVPPAIALFSRLLKDQGVRVNLFDTSGYNTGANDPDYVNEQILSVKPCEEYKNKMIKHDGENVFEDFNKRVEEFNPNLIAISATETDFLFATELIDSIKDRKILTILGGPFSTFAPERAIASPKIDMICVGEGEKSLVDLCHKLNYEQDYSNIPNLWVKKNGNVIKNNISPVIDINENPPLDFSIFDERRFYRVMSGKIYKMLPIETHRGCVYKCGFCCSPAQNKFYLDCTKSRFFRKKDIKNVEKDIRQYIKEYSPEYFLFWADDILSYSEKEIDEFCEMYSDIKIPFYAQARPESIRENKVKKLKEAGLNKFSIGIEHGNEKFRKEYLNRPYSNEQAIKATNILKDCDVPISLNVIIGFPDETPELAKDTINLISQMKYFNDVTCSIFQPYIGTALREFAIKKGYLDKDNIASHCSDTSVLNMPQFSKEQISGIHRTFNMYVRFPKERWNEIEVAEKLTPEGNEMWEKLRQELLNTHFT